MEQKTVLSEKSLRKIYFQTYLDRLSEALYWPGHTWAERVNFETRKRNPIRNETRMKFSKTPKSWKLKKKSKQKDRNSIFISFSLSCKQKNLIVNNFTEYLFVQIISVIWPCILLSEQPAILPICPDLPFFEFFQVFEKPETSIAPETKRNPICFRVFGFSGFFPEFFWPMYGPEIQKLAGECLIHTYSLTLNWCNKLTSFWEWINICRWWDVFFCVTIWFVF